MAGDAGDLLRLLALGPRAGAASGSAAAAGGPGVSDSASGADFASLLELARAGGVRTGLPVTVKADAGVDLSPDQLDRLAAAADLAQSEGVQVALVLMDDMALVLDVATRQVLGRGDRGDAVRSGIDGVVNLTGAGAADEPVAASGPTLSADVLGVLARAFGIGSTRAG